MADYYPLLARAIANLATNEIDIRQSIYARARDALDRQLKSLDPALADADILKEKLALEDVIRRIELEQLTPAPAPEATQEAAPEAAEPQAVPDQMPVLPVTLPKAERPKILPKSGDSPPGVAGQLPAEAKAEVETPQAAEPALPTGRILMPDQNSKRRRTSRLGLFAVGGVAAMIAMGALALTNRESPERYRQAAPVQPAEPVILDQSKREGRLASVDAPEPTPRQPPREAPAPVSPTPPVPAPTSPPSPTQNGATSPPPLPLPVLGRAFMILEVPGAPPNQYEGQANWSFAPDTAGKPGERLVRLQAEFVAAGLSVDFALSRNTDATLNASHTIFISFEPKPGMPPVREMSAIEWRERETQSGTPLIGVLVPIEDNAFMIGLDKSDAALARNLDLLQTQRWMVFEVRMGNGRRGAFLIEKGSAGDKVIADALKAWK